MVVKIDHALNNDAPVRAEALGSASFRRDHNLKYAYVAGAMYKGIASKELVVRLANANLLGYLGTGGLTLEQIESDIQFIKSHTSPGKCYGLNLLSNLEAPFFEAATVELYLRHGIKRVEAAAYVEITPSLVRYRVTGLRRRPDGTLEVPHRVLAKVSRPEVAEQFLSPPPPSIVAGLLAAGKIGASEAELAASIPMSEDVCVEADSGGHTDRGVAYALMPAMIGLRDEFERRFQYPFRIRVGAAGGLGTPHAIAAAFILGADFVLTGSINQCTVEAGTSDLVKDMLQQANIQDTAIAPAGDMFELGAKMQVLKKGVLFPVRANKLYDLYRQFDSWEAIDEKTRHQIETRYLRRSFDEVFEELRSYYHQAQPEKLQQAERNPKQKMALVFRWYFYQTNRWAMEGDPERQVDYQIQCGPAVGAFNQWVKGGPYENWRRRHVDELAEMLMQGAATLLGERFARLRSAGGAVGAAIKSTKTA